MPLCHLLAQQPPNQGPLKRGQRYLASFPSNRKVRPRERAERWAEQSRCHHCAALGEARLLLDELLQSLSMEERIVAVLLYEERYQKMEIHKILGRSRPYIDKLIRRIEQVSQRLYGGALS